MGVGAYFERRRSPAGATRARFVALTRRGAPSHLHAISFQFYRMRLSRNPHTPEMELISYEFRTSDIRL